MHYLVPNRGLLNRKHPERPDLENPAEHPSTDDSEFIEQRHFQLLHVLGQDLPWQADPKDVMAAMTVLPRVPEF